MKMPIRACTRREVTLSLLAMPFAVPIMRAAAAPRVSILDFGARADGVTINTKAIQAAIDHLAATGGGTLTVPEGVFLSGALFLKPRVDLHLDRGAVLRCATEMEHFPPQRTRIEGHYAEKFTPGLLNASGCDGLMITGEGTLDGAGRPIWDLFWKLRARSPDPGNFKNIGIERARLAVIEKSRGVTIEGVTFKDSQFWNLHLYRCRDVVVRGARFEVPDDYKQAPSTDGIDLDSCRNVVIDGCYFSVTDDCIAAKGTKGLLAMQDSDSPPVEHVRIRNCHFRRGHAAFTCGSEATVVRDVTIEDSKVTGGMSVAMLKLRPDTPQHYEGIHYRNLVLDSEAGSIIHIAPWQQYSDLKGHAPPRSIVRNVSFVNLRGRYGSLGTIRGNPGQTQIDGILVKDVDVTLLKGEALTAAEAGSLRFENVVVNGKAID